MLPSLSFFARATLKEGLPRTIAPVTAGLGIFSGTVTAGAAAILPCASMAYALNMKSEDIMQTFNTFLVVGAVCGAVVGYGLGYGGANLLIRTFPKLKNIESSLLLAPGITPQFALGVLSVIVPTSIMSNIALENMDKERNKKVKPDESQESHSHQP